ncbi:hypothetical protein RJ639_047821 [Escallonia herrerae]|uniref:Uncharacterized protein n=1 Tax=Escallonia herrerae TaxID=1293975 RepID=A0AA89AZ83_9ASTE|nr:hypothetical protein RJ639_047821 [Escallonia herrerae]
MGLNIHRLKVLNIARNRLTGAIPVSITNASNLVRLAGNGNGFTGRVPNFNGLQTLEWLALNENQLGSGEAGDLSFFSSLITSTELYLVSLVENNFGGTLPKSIGNISNLVTLALRVNQISGNIPPEIGKLAKLESLFLGPNQLTGSIPSSIGNLQKDQAIVSLGKPVIWHYSFFFGSDTSTVAKCENLQLIDLSYNDLSDNIPRDVFGLPSLSIFLDLSNNHLTGPLLLEKGDLKNLGYFDVSNNLLSDEIPGSLGSCTSIPQSLSSLRAIEVLDLSRNKLTGKIPDYLGKFMFLKNLILSFNDFEGKVPEGRIFKNASEVTLDGNSKLCGGVRDLQLPRCGTKHAVSHVLKLSMPLSCGLLLLILAFFYVFVYKRRLAKKRKKRRHLGTIKFPLKENEKINECLTSILRIGIACSKELPRE